MPTEASCAQRSAPGQAAGARPSSAGSALNGRANKMKGRSGSSRSSPRATERRSTQGRRDRRARSAASPHWLTISSLPGPAGTGAAAVSESVKVVLIRCPRFTRRELSTMSARHEDAARRNLSDAWAAQWRVARRSAASPQKTHMQMRFDALRRVIRGLTLELVHTQGTSALEFDGVRGKARARPCRCAFDESRGCPFRVNRP